MWRKKRAEVLVRPRRWEQRVPACPPAAQVGLGWVGRGARGPPTRGSKVAILGRPQAFVEQLLQARFPDQRTEENPEIPSPGGHTGRGRWEQAKGVGRVLVCVCACVSIIILPWGRQGQLGPWWPVGTGDVRFVQEQWLGCCCAIRSFGGTNGHRAGWGGGQWGLGEGSPEGRGCTTRGGRQRHEGSWGQAGDWPGRTLAHLSWLPRL